MEAQGRQKARVGARGLRRHPGGHLLAARRWQRHAWPAEAVEREAPAFTRCGQASAIHPCPCRRGQRSRCGDGAIARRMHAEEASAAGVGTGR
eukprot:354021-Chlamydomonas_euryale.AAC.1